MERRDELSSSFTDNKCSNNAPTTGREEENNSVTFPHQLEWSLLAYFLVITFLLNILNHF